MASRQEIERIITDKLWDNRYRVARVVGAEVGGAQNPEHALTTLRNVAHEIFEDLLSIDQFEGFHDAHA